LIAYAIPQRAAEQDGVGGCGRGLVRLLRRLGEGGRQGQQENKEGGKQSHGEPRNSKMEGGGSVTKPFRNWVISKSGDFYELRITSYELMECGGRKSAVYHFQMPRGVTRLTARKSAIPLGSSAGVW
jgi:hypothetical protein